ncbi:MAG: type II secretion system protein [Candidatus Methylopumilus sp.]
MAPIMRIGELKQSGYALLAMLVLIIIIGFTLAEAGALWSDARRRDREQELLKIGDKFRIAIGQYYNNTPGPIKRYPPTLDALLRDDRNPIPRRYLRAIYIDPVTGRADWGTLEAPSGGVMGVYSLSGQRPFKRSQFRPINKELENKKMYGDWIFAYLPQVHDTSPAN